MQEIFTSADDRLDLDARGISRDIQEVDRVIMVLLPHITDVTVKTAVMITIGSESSSRLVAGPRPLKHHFLIMTDSSH